MSLRKMIININMHNFFPRSGLAWGILIAYYISSLLHVSLVATKMVCRPRSHVSLVPPSLSFLSGLQGFALVCKSLSLCPVLLSMICLLIIFSFHYLCKECFCLEIPSSIKSAFQVQCLYFHNFLKQEEGEYRQVRT